MEECLFCKIINEEIPAEIVYSDESVVAFLDISPINPGHVLVIPREHTADFLSASGEMLRSLISVTQKVAKAVVEGLDYKGFNLGVNSGAVAGQVVPHLHFHIMPRQAGDGHALFAGREYGDGEMAAVAKKIINKLK